MSGTKLQGLLGPSEISDSVPSDLFDIPEPANSPAETETVRTQVEEAAVLGGTPAFSRLLHVGRPNLPPTASFVARIETMLASGWLSNGGPFVKEFEATVADIAGAQHCVTTCNGTLALELAIAALGLKGEVIVPSFTFVATVHALSRQGIKPVFCDIDPTKHCLDADLVESAITPKTTGIMAVTLWGNPCDEVRLREIADRHGLKLLFDSAHAFGCDLNRSHRRRLCDLEVYSFHATKCIQALEGGAIVTDDAALADRLRQSKNFGFTGEDTVAFVGTNAKMNEASAAMGLCSIEQSGVIFDRNRQNFEAYAAGLEDIDGLSIAVQPIGQRHNYQYVVLDIDESVVGLSRDQLVTALRAENILARRYFHPGVHRMKPYSDTPCSLPVTEVVADRVVIMPNGMSISPTDVASICRRIKLILERSTCVSMALQESELL